MLTKLRQCLKLILKRIPPIANYFAGCRLNEINLRRKFSVELDLTEGKHPGNTPRSKYRQLSEKPSIIHFSVNKAATQYTRQILGQCAVENNMILVNIHAYAFNSNFPYLDQLSAEEMGKYQHVFKPDGYLYSTFGGMIEGIPGLEKYKIILMVRDPRDVLVSEYYSIAYSHAAPGIHGNKYKHFVREKASAVKSAIDDYAVAENERVYNVMLRYKTLLIDKYPNVYLTKYEEMINDFPDWLGNLLDYCELNISRDSFTALVEKNEQMRPKDENIHQHVRKGKSGEYREKLKPETIEYLNQKFSPMLLAFKYNQACKE